MTDLYFKIDANGYLISVEAKSYERDWIPSIVHLNGAGFNGVIQAELNGFSFTEFKRELESLYQDLRGSAKFTSREGQIEISIVGDGTGKLSVECEASNSLNWDSFFKMRFEFDQTFLPEIISQLSKVADWISTEK